MKSGGQIHGTICVPYSRSTKPFVDHVFTNQKDLFVTFLKHCAQYTGDEATHTIDGKEMFFLNYEARTTQDIPVPELSSDPEQRRQDVFYMRKQWHDIRNKMSSLQRTVSEVDTLVRSMNTNWPVGTDDGRKARRWFGFE